MSKQSPEYWEKVTQARDALEEQLKHNADVYYVDVGYAQGNANVDEPSLRVHLCGEHENGTFPRSVDGIPVVISGE